MWNLNLIADFNQLLSTVDILLAKATKNFVTIDNINQSVNCNVFSNQADIVVWNDKWYFSAFKSFQKVKIVLNSMIWIISASSQNLYNDRNIHQF